MNVQVRPVAGEAEREACARLMAGTEPWITLGRSYGECMKIVRDPTREVYWLEHDGAWAGFMILLMKDGPFRGYVQTICVTPEHRNRGVGTAALRWAEERIFRESPNVFLCVSDFNQGARRLYEREGYEFVGELRDFLVPGKSELLYRKTRGSWSDYMQSPPAAGSTRS